MLFHIIEECALLAVLLFEKCRWLLLFEECRRLLL